MSLVSSCLSFLLVSAFLVCPSHLYYLSCLCTSCLLSTLSFLISLFLSFSSLLFSYNLFSSFSQLLSLLQFLPHLVSSFHLILSLVLVSAPLVSFFSSWPFIVSPCLIFPFSFPFLLFPLYFLVFVSKLVFCLSISFHNFVFSNCQPFLSSHLRNCQRKSHFYWSDQSLIAQNPLQSACRNEDPLWQQMSREPPFLEGLWIVFQKKNFPRSHPIQLISWELINQQLINNSRVVQAAYAYYSMGAGAQGH